MPSNAQYWAIAFTVLSIAIVSPYIMKLFGGNQFDVKGKTVLLTGASEGMGKSVAVQLAQKGANVIIVARNVTKLETALREVQSAAADPTTQRFKYISADMSVDDAATRVIAEATAWNNEKSLDVVWCIAGSAFPSFFLETSKSKARQQMDTNYWSCWDMAQAALGQWLHPSATKGTQRHLIFTSSVIAFYGIVGYAPYGPAKTAIKSLSDTLAQEVLLYGDDIKIHTIFPATIQSPGLQTENLTKPDITRILEESDPVQTPDVVAANSIKGLEKGEYLVTVGWLGDAMRACGWGGSKRNSWVLDTLMTWITAIIWLFVGPDLDGKVKSYGKKHGHPSTYPKKS